MPRNDSVRVVVCDDSLVAREMLSQILASDPNIEVVGQAKDGAEAVDMVSVLKPDLVTMDIHMPKMDGLKATEQIMAFTPTPILVVSTSVHGQGMGLAFEALTFGALDVVKKPEPADWADLEGIGRDLIGKVKLLANVRVVTHIQGRRVPSPVRATVTGNASGRGIVAIGASTGGPSALLSVLAALPEKLPGAIVVAQHIADGFIPGLVAWLGKASGNSVVEATDGDMLEPGVVYVAPTSCNLSVLGRKLVCESQQAGQLHVPSIDRLLESVADACGSRAVGVLLTGMGTDGARGLKRLRDVGAATIAQNEETSIVFGMPKAAIDAGAVHQVLPVDEIGEAIARLVSGRSHDLLEPRAS